MILIKILILIVSNMEEHMSSFIDDYRDVYKECYCKAEGEIKCEQMLTMIANAYDLNKMERRDYSLAKKCSLNSSEVSEKI